jgi:hypothetical protein
VAPSDDFEDADSGVDGRVDTLTIETRRLQALAWIVSLESRWWQSNIDEEL